ncbi:MAG: hypothetical protein MSC43_08250 [Clostridiales bacterium]|nr:hypothetical protein [Clostridiales bacterium]MDD7432884.1 hypothetical protein [Clostridiales bacterium]MDY3061577.1 hypothetical protein [Eubacteriales bacterium]
MNKPEQNRRINASENRSQKAAGKIVDRRRRYRCLAFLLLFVFLLTLFPLNGVQAMPSRASDGSLAGTSVGSSIRITDGNSNGLPLDPSNGASARTLAELSAGISDRNSAASSIRWNGGKRLPAANGQNLTPIQLPTPLPPQPAPLQNEPAAQPSGGDPFAFTPSSEYPFQMQPSPQMAAVYCNGFALLDFEIENISKKNLKINEVVLEASAGDNFPFEVNQARIFGCPEPGAWITKSDVTSVVFPPLFVKPNVADGYYDLNFIIRFQEESSGYIYEQKLNFPLRVIGDPANKKDQRVLLAPAQLPTQSGQYGQAMNLQFGLVNRGFDPADIISVTPVVAGDAEAWPFEIERTDYSMAVGRTLFPLPPGAQMGDQGTGTLVLCDFGQVTVRSKIKSGYKELKFRVKYKYGYQEIKDEDFSIFVDIAGDPVSDSEGRDKDSGPTSKPRLLCQGYETNPAKVKGGEKFHLTVHLHNTSSLTAIQNIQVTLSSDQVGENGSVPFLTENGAASLFIPYIEAEGDYDLEVDMVSSSQVPQRNYNLKLDMEYEDLKATAIQAREAISIPLHQEARVDHGKIEIMPEQINVGQEANLSCLIFNKGKTTLYNLTVLVPEGQGISGAEAYLGNVNSGESKTLDMMIKAEESFSPDQPRKLKMRFEDENGAPTEKEIEFPLTVMEDNPMDMPPGMSGMSGMDAFPTDENGNPLDPSMAGEMNGPASGLLSLMPLWAWILLGVCLLILLVMSISSFRRKRRKKRMAMEDEAYFRDLMK